MEKEEERRRDYDNNTTFVYEYHAFLGFHVTLT